MPAASSLRLLMLTTAYCCCASPNVNGGIIAGHPADQCATKTDDELSPGVVVNSAPHSRPLAPSQPRILAPGPSLTLNCGGCSQQQPYQGNRATARVDFAADDVSNGGVPAWIRLDRCDSVYDNTFYHDWWPRWAKTADGSFEFDWLHGTPATAQQPRPCPSCPPVERLTVVASGWSARYNGTRLTANSTNRSIYFSFSYWGSLSLLEVQNRGPPASVLLTGKPGAGVNGSAAMRVAWADTCQFKAYKLDTSGKYAPKLNFKADPMFHQTTPVILFIRPYCVFMQ
jgi:hypothetical protein